MDDVQLTTDLIGLLQHKGVEAELVAPESSRYAGGTGSNDDYIMHFDSNGQACARCNDPLATMLATSSGD